MQGPDYEILVGDVRDRLRDLPAGSVHCVATSPPYLGLRSYGVPPSVWPEVEYAPMAGLPPVTVPAMESCLGLEPDPLAYVGHLVLIWRELWRVLRDDGTCWLNLGSSYASGGSNPTQSPRDPRVPACGSVDTEPRCCLPPGCACPYRRDALPGATPIHHCRTENRNQPLQRCELPRQQTARGSGLKGSVEEGVCSGLPDALASTTRASSLSAVDAFSPADPALELRLEHPTSEPCAPLCECKSASPCASPITCASDRGQPSHTDGIGLTGDASDLHIAGTASGCSSCRYYTTTFRQSQFKPKDLILIPSMVAMALQAGGWYLRSAIVWAKGISFCPSYSGSVMPESVQDRPTSAHEMVYLLAKRPTYFYDAEAVKECSIHAGVHVSTHGNDGMDAGYDGHRTRDGLRRGITVAAARNLRNVWAISPRGNYAAIRTSHWAVADRDALCDGMRRIASPDCPVHGLLGRSHPTRECGECEDGESIRTSRTCDHLDQTQQGDCDAIDQTPSLSILEQSSGSPLLSCAPSATGRSTQIHRTDLAPSTSPSCSACEGIGDRTEHTLARHASQPSCGHTQSSSTGEDDSCECPSEETLSRSECIVASEVPPECTCSFYHKITQSASHFACWPEELVRPMVRAGTSQAGCCAECGAPCERVVEREKAPRRATDSIAAKTANVRPQGSLSTERWDEPDMTRTTGWRPTCACDAGVQPCVVLDCFAGSGTTGRVALQLGRRFIGIDANPSYAEMARAGCENYHKPIPRPAREAPEQPGLFEEAA